MSVNLVKKAIQKFIATDTVEAICIKGRWGVGKTYAWKTFMAEAKRNKRVGMKAYSYVSLFGLNSVDELRQAIFENMETVHDGFSDQSLEKRLKVIRDEGLRRLRRASRLVPYLKVPYIDTYIQNLAGGFRHILSLSVKDAIICVDDIERKGAGLLAVDVLGVMSQLKEERNCKIAFIMNDGALEGGEKAVFDKYFEKVIDTSVEFSPTPEEAASIAIRGSDKLSDWIRKGCVELEISNIRAIKRIERVVTQLCEIISIFDDDVKKQSVRCMIVLAWCAYGVEFAPTVKFLQHKRYDQWTGFKEDVEYSEDEVKWGKVLDAYGFTHFDEFDLLLVSAILKGVFDDEAIVAQCERMEAILRQGKGDAALTEAWSKYHGSFDDDAPEVVASLYNGTLANIKCLTPLNLNGAVGILKRLGVDEKASELIRSYGVARAGETDLFDLTKSPFSSEITDPDVIAMFKTQNAAAATILPTPLEACRRIYKGAWSPSDEEALERLSEDDLYSLFKGAKGDDLLATVGACLEFRKFGNVTARQKAIVSKAIGALKQIAAETPLNRMRMRKFRVEAELNETLPHDAS
jgi:hypothetical protein